MGWRTPDINLAGAFLRRMAPTQTHEGRHEFHRAADLLNVLDGIEAIDENPIAISLVVKADGKHVGNVEFMVVRHGDEVSAHPFLGQDLYRPLTPEQIAERDGRTEDDGFVGEGT